MAERKSAKHLIQLGLGPIDDRFVNEKAAAQGASAPDVLRQCVKLARDVESILLDITAGRMDGNTPIRYILPLICLEPTPQTPAPQKPPRKP